MDLSTRLACSGIWRRASLNAVGAAAWTGEAADVGVLDATADDSCGDRVERRDKLRATAPLLHQFTRNSDAAA